MTHPGRGEHRSGPSRRYLVARRYLFQLLTGADLNDTRHPLGYRSPADRTRHLSAVEKMNTPLRHVLHEHAARHLHRLGIDEPVTWAPPTSLCAGLNLPGRDPDDIDLDRLQHLVVIEQQSLLHAARDLDTTLEHVRLAVERIDRAPGPWASNLAQASRQRDQQRGALLTREFFEREVKHTGKSRSQLRNETGIPINVLSRYAKRAGIALVGRQPVGIETDWLAEQYVHHRRSFADIAYELGIDAQTVNDAAHSYGIPVRSPGIQSHPDLITKLDRTLPADVRRAVEGQLHGWQRLRRFQQTMAYPSLKSASAHLDVQVTSLVQQFKRLERDIGAQLFHRSTPTRPKQLTQRGADLLAALEDPQVQALLQRHGHPPRKTATRQRHVGGHRNLPTCGHDHDQLAGEGQPRHGM
jgi:regulatory helix-turn-helix LysR family protein